MWDILFLTAFVIISMFVYDQLFSSKKDIKKRLDELTSSRDNSSINITDALAEDEELKKSFFDRMIKPMLEGLSKKMAKKSKREAESELQRMLVQAGSPGNMSPGEWKIMTMMVAIIPTFISVLTGLLLGISAQKMVMASVMILVFSFLIPRIWLQRRVKTRQFQIQRTLPDFLDLMTVSVEAGLGFDIALSKVGQKMKGALAEEISIVLKEIQMGKPRKESLRDLGDRMEVDDLSSFVSAVVQADTLGVSVTKVLKVQSEQARDKRAQRAEEMAQQAPVKMMLPLVGFIFPTIMIVLMGGAVLGIADALIFKR